MYVTKQTITTQLCSEEVILHNCSKELAGFRLPRHLDCGRLQSPWQCQMCLLITGITSLHMSYIEYIHDYSQHVAKRKSQGIDDRLLRASSVQSGKHIRFCYCLFYTIIIIRHISSGDTLHSLLYLCDTIFRCNEF